MANSADLYQHFRPEEAAIIDQLADAIETARGEYRPVLTDFLDPRQRLIADNLANRAEDVMIGHFGGYAHAERQRLLIAPSYFVPQQQDFDVALLEIDYPQKFATLTHSQILGTLANSGIARDLFGDIINLDMRWQFFVVQGMVAWVQDNIKQIGKIGVRFAPRPLDEALPAEDDWEPIALSLSALRLDTFIAHGFNISRQRSKELIQGRKVQLNFRIVEQPDVVLGEADIVSVRGFGRLRFDTFLGLSKKGKNRIAASIIRK